MPLVNSRKLLSDAKKHGYAVGAFNVENMEMAQAVVEAAKAECAPVIIQTTPSTLRYAGAPVFAAMVRALADEADVPVALHLDHGDSLEICILAAKSGYTSLMIDGSKLPFDENIALTRRVAEKAAAMPGHPAVEAELGRLGGKEDDVSGEALYTDPAAAARFAAKTGIDALAVAIGNAHGFYRGKPKLDFDRLAKLHAAVDLPLVLHGSSGIPDEDIKRAVGLGICKVNFATELRAAYTAAVRAALDGDSSMYDPKKIGTAGRDAVSKLVRRRIAVCGAGGRA